MQRNNLHIQRLLSLFFIALLVLVTFEELSIYLSFKMNQTYIAENLCVEREIEDSDCAGCCQLNKKIEENRAEAPLAPTESNTKIQLKLVYVEHDTLKSNKALLELTRMQLLCKHESLYNFCFVKDCFHPPQAA